jgi:hypothetical protein
MMAADFFGQRLPVDDWSRRMLFPDQRDAIWLPERELGRAKFGLDWVDKELNYEQQVVTLRQEWANNRNPLTQSYQGHMVIYHS